MLVGMSLLTACTSLDATKAKEDIREILLPKNQLENSTPMENTKIEEKVEVEKSEWKLSLETMPEVLTSIRMELKNNQKMVFDAKVNKISLYVGQTAVIKDNAGMNKLKLLVSPQKSNPNLKTGSSMFTFRSIYQGTYVVAWETLSGVKKQLTIENHLKYKFTEEEKV